MSNIKVPIYGEAVKAVSPVQNLHKNPNEILKTRDKRGSVIKINANGPGFKSPVDISWLPFAAPKYDISPNIKDYVIANVPALTSDLPNRNSQAFTLKTLTEFDPEQGCMVYQTFKGKPSHIEHQNKILNKAKGIIFDASLVSVPKYGIAKIYLLTGFCRQKDPVLAEAILSGRSSGYSMGALSSTFRCSVCGGILGPSVKRTCLCYPSDYNTLDLLGGVYKGRLHYHAAVDPTFIEISAVADPADSTAWGSIL